MTKLPLAIAITLCFSLQAQANKECLTELTELAASSKQCQVKQTIDENCDAEIRQVEIQRLTCLRDGADPDRVATSVQLGELMVEGDVKDSPANAWLEKRVAELVNVRLDTLLETQIQQRLGGIASVVNSQSAELEVIDAALATVEGRVLQVGSDMEFQFSVERDERAKLASDLNAKIRQASQPQGTSVELERRLRTIEERLKAVDASRASLNAELLKVQGEVNQLVLSHKKK